MEEVKKLIKHNGRYDWTPESIKYLLNNCYDKSCSELAKQLGCDKTVVLDKLSRINAFTDKPNPRKNNPVRLFTSEEDDFMRKHYSSMCSSEIAANLNRSLHHVKNRARRLGLKRTKEETDRLRLTPGALPDGVIARHLSGGNNPELKEYYMNQPNLLGLKRMQMVLKGKLKNL